MRHALITGGGSGIGAATARALAATGARITLVGRDEAKLKSVAAELDGACIAVADVVDEGAIARAFEKARAAHGAVNILVNNAGIAPSAPFVKTGRKTWDSVLAINVTGAYVCTQAALPDMLAANWGRVINIASVASLRGAAYATAYCASKHALLGLTRALALETAKTGITVNAVCPSFVETPMLTQSVDRIVAKTKLDADAARAAVLSANPQGRAITPEEVAATVVWLCAAESASVNGAAIPLSGGAV